jgi:hypothetical protein
MNTQRRGVHEMAPVVFMKPFVGGGDESMTRPPPRETHEMPASGPAFCFGDDRVLVDGRVEVALTGLFLVAGTPVS